MVMAEAGNQPPEAQGRVAGVIVNRVDDKRFPSDYASVLSEPGQFDPYKNGTYQAALRRVATKPDDPAVIKAMKVAGDVMTGKIKNPAGDHIYFQNPDIATNAMSIPWTSYDGDDHVYGGKVQRTASAQRRVDAAAALHGAPQKFGFTEEAVNNALGWDMAADGGGVTLKDGRAIPITVMQARDIGKDKFDPKMETTIRQISEGLKAAGSNVGTIYMADGHRDAPAPGSATGSLHLVKVSPDGSRAIDIDLSRYDPATQRQLVSAILDNKDIGGIGVYKPGAVGHKLLFHADIGQKRIWSGDTITKLVGTLGDPAWNNVRDLLAARALESDNDNIGMLSAADRQKLAAWASMYPPQMATLDDPSHRAIARGEMPTGIPNNASPFRLEAARIARAVDKKEADNMSTSLRQTILYSGLDTGAFERARDVGTYNNVERVADAVRSAQKAVSSTVSATPRFISQALQDRAIGVGAMMIDAGKGLAFAKDFNKHLDARILQEAAKVGKEGLARLGLSVAPETTRQKALAIASDTMKAQLKDPAWQKSNADKASASFKAMNESVGATIKAMTNSASSAVGSAAKSVLAAPGNVIAAGKMVATIAKPSNVQTMKPVSKPPAATPKADASYFGDVSTPRVPGPTDYDFSAAVGLPSAVSPLAKLYGADLNPLKKTPPLSVFSFPAAPKPKVQYRSVPPAAAAQAAAARSQPVYNSREQGWSNSGFQQVGMNPITGRPIFRDNNSGYAPGQVQQLYSDRSSLGNTATNSVGRGGASQNAAMSFGANAIR